MSRTNKAIKNSIFGLSSYAIITIMTFFMQMVFVRTLGYSYLGLNSLFNTIIATLSISQLGIGTAIIFSMYKPLAEGDRDKVFLLMQLYKKIYFIIGFVVLGAGICFIPFLTGLVGNAFNFTTLLPIFLLFLLNSFLSYFFTYNQSILNADQKTYVISFISTLTRIAMISVQIVFLLIKLNYIYIVFTTLIFTFASNVFIARYVKKKYKVVKLSGKLDKSETQAIKKNVVALIYHQIGNYLVTGTDNIIISIFLGVEAVGFYSCYVMISSVISVLISNLLIGITSGLGNVFATENKQKVKEIFLKVQFLYFVIFAVSTVGIYVMADKLLILWLGKETILSTSFLLVFCCNFYLTGYSIALGNLRAAAGVYSPDKYLHIIIAVVNLVLSIILVQHIGITGVLVGTLACLIIKECIVLPIIGSVYIYGGSPFEYYFRLILQFAILVGICALTLFIVHYIVLSNAILSFVIGAIVCLVLPLLLISCLYFWTQEYKYFINLGKNIIVKLLKIKKIDNI